MEPLSKIISIGAGAFLGANLRYWLGGWVQSKLGAGFPWGTLAVNVSGSLLIGLAMGIALEQGWPLQWRLFLVVGVLGGYTTFSAFAYEALNLLADENWLPAIGYMASSMLVTVLSAWGGRMLARLVAGG